MVSKRERRLWFGDWQRDDQGDTFVVLPEDGPDDVPPAADRRRPLVAGAAAVLLLFMLVVALLSGGQGTPVPPRPAAQAPFTPGPQAPVQPPQGAVPQGGFGGPDLTGAEAARAAQAALGKFPGQIERVTRGPSGGGYVVHVFTPDGYEVHVLVDGGFHVQGSDQSGGPNTFGPGGNTQ